MVRAGWEFGQKKPVLAVPGAVTSSLSAGTNWLIKNGAKLATDANDVLAELGESLQGPSLQVRINLTGEEKQVVELLKREEMDADEICRKLNQPISSVSILLSNLALEGAIEESGGKFMVI